MKVVESQEEQRCHIFVVWRKDRRHAYQVLMAVLLEQISSNIYMEAVYEAHVRTRCSQTPMMRLFDYVFSLNPEPIAHLGI